MTHIMLTGRQKKVQTNELCFCRMLATWYENMTTHSEEAIFEYEVDGLQY